MYNELNEQLELGFDRNVIRAEVPRTRRRVARAGWWFDQIRKMIDADEVLPTPRVVQGRLEFSPTRTVSFPA
ncbi:MAG: hypothetical protein H8E27_13325 [Verrucomicrobia subdivision 3 bacterium]|nr:hypothetical protein [Limisphaerales bacterium]